MLDFFKSRRSTRKYQDRPVPADLIEQVVEAGRYAPSGGNNQTCHFLVVTDSTVLARLAETTQEAFAGMEVTENTYRSLAFAIQAAKRGGYVFHYHAPVLIIAANKKDYGNNIADTACALENMMLMANALDLGSCWINQLRWLNEDPALLAYERELGLAEDERVYGAVALGWPDTPDGLPERTPLPRTGNRTDYI